MSDEISSTAAPAAFEVEQPLGESADPALVSIEGLSVHYLGRENWVLDAVDLAHLRAQVTAVIGPAKARIIYTAFHPEG